MRLRTPKAENAQNATMSKDSIYDTCFSTSKLWIAAPAEEVSATEDDIKFFDWEDNERKSIHVSPVRPQLKLDAQLAPQFTRQRSQQHRPCIYNINSS